MTDAFRFEINLCYLLEFSVFDLELLFNLNLLTL